MSKHFLPFFMVLLSVGAFAQSADTFTNPVIRRDMADPCVIRIQDTYYATGTSSEWAPFYPVYTSQDLVNWQQTGHIFNEKPAWTSNSFWAPELYYHKGRVYCYYTARRKQDGVTCIGVASSPSPTQAFTDHGPIVEFGSEAIDAFVYDDNGQLYITWKAYGLDKRPIEILGSRLSDNGLRLEGEPFSLLTDVEDIGMEGQYHFKHGDYYYLVYSAHSCCGPGSDYDVYVARSRSFRGPYEKYAGNPILHGGKGEYQSCGHGTAVSTPDDRMFYLCHAYMKGEGFYAGRQSILQEMIVTDDGWVQFKTGSTAVSEQPLPFAGAKQEPVADFIDEFDQEKLNVAWSWNYPYSDIQASVKEGFLWLAGRAHEGNSYGTALCLSPQKARYAYQTQVINRNASFKGLTMYGDDANLIAWGVVGDKLVLKAIKDREETILYESACPSERIFLKIGIDKGCLLTFFFSKDGKQWSTATEGSLDSTYTVRWDRVARPGLLHIGECEEPAGFSQFRLEY